MATETAQSPRTAAVQAPQLLRFATAGSVDDGKSTLIGRLLLDTKLLMADQLEAVSQGNGGVPDLAALTDGLRAELSGKVERDQMGIGMVGAHFSVQRVRALPAKTG